MWNIPLFELNYDHREEAAVQEAVESRWLTMGDRTAEFERQFSLFLGGGECVAVSSCTAALHLSLLALDIGPGDEVIIPGLTFVADINAVKLTGATPVVADSISLQDWNVDAESIESRISDKTKAVIVVHFAGYPCEMEKIVGICRRYGISLIEDVAHAPGAEVDGKACGTFGDIGCFSFFSNKNLAVGEGGMAVTKGPELWQRIRLLRSHGMTTPTLDRHRGRAHSYDVARPGLNYRIDEIRSSIGIVQLTKLAEGNRQRGRLVDRYRKGLSDRSSVLVPFYSTEGKSAYHIFPILLPEELSREAVVDRMKARGIQTSLHYPSFRSFSAYRSEKLAPTPVADEISARCLTLPLFPTMTFRQVDMVINALVDALTEQ